MNNDINKVELTGDIVSGNPYSSIVADEAQTRIVTFTMRIHHASPMGLPVVSFVKVFTSGTVADLVHLQCRQGSRVHVWGSISIRAIDGNMNFKKVSVIASKVESITVTNEDYK